MASWPERPFTALEAAVVEANAVALGMTVDQLMENAGRAVAEEASRRLPPAPAVVAVLCGSGNNGGDGSVAAHYLYQWGHRPEVWFVRPPAEIRSSPARHAYERLRREVSVREGVPPASSLSEAALIVDALLGTGLTGELKEPYRSAAAAVAQSARPVLSVDLPSGLGTEAAVRPRWTVALSAVKAGTTAANGGEIVVRDIGVPEEARSATGPGEFLAYPLSRPGPRSRSARVVVIGGGPYAGAPALSALAALRAGAERATVLAPAPAADRIQAFSPDLVVRPVGEGHFTTNDLARFGELFARESVQGLVVGPGVGSDPATAAVLGRLVERFLGRVPVVLDAEALPALAELLGRVPQASDLIATPNTGEFRRHLARLRPDDPIGPAAVTEAAARFGLTVLVKGAVDLFSDGATEGRNLNHPAAQAVAGSGDVLSGVIGALRAMGLGALPSIRLATYWVGEAGHRAYSLRGPGLVATDLLEALGPTLLAGLGRSAVSRAQA